MRMRTRSLGVSVQSAALLELHACKTGRIYSLERAQTDAIVFAVLLTLLLNAFALALFFVRTIHLQLRTHAIGVHLSELVHAKV